MIQDIHIGWPENKVTMNIAMVKLYIKQGKSVVFATADQQQTITMLSSHFRNALFELVEDWGVRVHVKA